MVVFWGFGSDFSTGSGSGFGSGSGSTFGTGTISDTTCNAVHKQPIPIQFTIKK